ncbi:hypothetical protein ACJMK2_038297 [Sinanodonta woodiana]|uniref:Transmembrane protein 141 n=1 Tax=Sinanodonta woodiana TaxID=1069815 RepID=A0ABD3W8J9_SINWO
MDSKSLEVYKECQRNAFQTGIYTFVATGVSTYILQDLIKSKLPYKAFGHLLAAPLLMGSLCSYLITRKKAKICGAMWMAMEDKHTAIEKSKIDAVQR